MITIGHTYVLKVIKLISAGAILDAEDLGEVLLPNKYHPTGLALNDSLEVFIYLDSNNRPIATTQKPKAEVGEFAYLNAIAETDFGIFLDWGLDKDLLVPFGEQHRPMEAGNAYLVYIYVGQADGRITASSKVEKFLDDEKPHDFKPKQKVDLIIANSTDLGFKAIINHSHWGVLYKNEVNERLSFGQQKTGFIKYIRPDGKIDLALEASQEIRDKYSKTILKYLQDHNNFAAVHDKSDPALIQKLFGMSKKAFKKTIGGLYKGRVIAIEKDGIRLLDEKV